MAGMRGENQDICGHIVLGTSTYPTPLSPSNHCMLAYNIVRKSLKSVAPYYEAPIRHESCQTTIAIFHLRDGKIAEEWVNRDELGMLLDLGVVAPAATPS
jgi:hypothetical protein